MWLLKHHTVNLAQDILSRNQLIYGIAEENCHFEGILSIPTQARLNITSMGLVINLTSKNETHKQQ
jgi:hypothetical protein